ncbi:hypothetical protein V8C34DRAFT_72015 [Trichoderma compactum]
MSSDQPEPSRPRRVRIPRLSAARRTRSVSQQSASPRLSARHFIVSSSSSSSSNASSSPSSSSRSSATSRASSPRIATPQESSPAVTEAEKITYWPGVREYVNNGGHEAGLGPIEIHCLICDDELAVRGIEPSEELIQQREGVVMTCGHIFCRPCLTKWFHQQRTCPACRDRESTVCRECQAQARWVTIPMEHNDVEEVPPTILELAGEKLPSTCVRCEARRWWTFNMDHGRHGLPSRGVIDSDFQRLMCHMMERSEKEHMAMGMVEMEEQLLVLFKEHFMRLLEAREQYISQYAQEPWNARNHAWG